MNSRFLIVTGLLVALSALAQDYEIRLHRPQRVGDKEKFSAIGTQVQDMSAWAGAQSLKEEKKYFTVELDGLSTIETVTAAGKPTRLSLRIEKLIRVEGAIRKEVLPRDTVVIASGGEGKTVFEVNGKAVAPDVAEALGAVVSGLSGKPQTDDDAFGTRERKRVGDTWDINATALAALMDSSKMLVKDLAGKVTLTKVLTDAPGPRLLITFQITGKPASNGPAAPSMEAALTMKGTGEFPIDTSLPRVKETLDMTFNTRVKRGDTEVRMTAKQSLQKTVRK